MATKVIDGVEYVLKVTSGNYTAEASGFHFLATSAQKKEVTLVTSIDHGNNIYPVTSIKASAF